jgi:formylglycine-generating enzyme required for sulfatase activity
MNTAHRLLPSGLLAAALVHSAPAADFGLGAETGYAKLQAAGVGMDFAAVADLGATAATPSTRGWGTVGYAYSIGTTEVTWAQYAVFLNDTRYDSYMFSSTQAPYIGLSRNADGSVNLRLGCADKAVNVVRYAEAVAFANWLGTGSTATTGDFRLPTADEWYKAAYHDPLADTFRLYGTGADTLTTADAFYGYLSVGPTSDAYPTVTYGTANGYGLHGMTGGVEEWTGTAQNSAGTRHWALGGAWNLTETQLTNARVNNLADTAANDKLGFRLATTLTAIPEPSTYAFVLGLGCLAIVLRCRRSAPKSR